MFDNIDKQILNALQQNARMTNRELAEQLNLSTTPVYERIKKLEKKGIIRSFVALLDAKKVNRGLTAITKVRLDVHSTELIEAFTKKIKTFDEVMECYHTTGDADFILKVKVSDMDGYYRFIMEKLTLTADVAHIDTSFVLNEIKYTTAIQL